MDERLSGSNSPHIDIVRSAGAIVIRQHRPMVLSHLAGLGVDRALAMVPTLLPVCGVAQSVAAQLRTGSHYLCKVPVYSQVKAVAAQGLAQGARDMQLVRKQHGAWIRRPP